MIAFANAIETLRLANYVEGRECYRWPVYSLDGSPTVPSSGVAATPTYAFDASGDLPDVLVVCGGVNDRYAGDAALEGVLIEAARRGVVLDALRSGTSPSRFQVRHDT